jgi:transcriptional regulator with XRE-family HTH domain
LSNQLKDIIQSRGLTAYAVGRMAEVDPGVVQRFLTGERDIRLETADRIGAALGLRLVELGRKVRGRPAREVEPEQGPEASPAGGIEAPDTPGQP